MGKDNQALTLTLGLWLYSSNVGVGQKHQRGEPL